MTAPNCLYIMAIALMILGWGTFARAEGDAASDASSTSGALAPDGTPIVHKSLHKKKKSTAATTTPVTGDPVVTVSKPSSTVIAVPKPADGTLTVTAKPGQPGLSGAGPAVETGLPVPRHVDLNSTALGGGAPSGLADGSYRNTVASNLTGLSNAGNSMTAATLGGYTSTQRSDSSSNFPYADFPTKKPTHTYPWHMSIYTTMFYIGEGGSSISSTDNHASSFDTNWEDNNRGSDNPNNRNGYASGSHASTVNPFYIALPFNDLVYPDKAREYLPAWWHRPNKDGKPVSACKDRWVEIKTEDGSGKICYAQWEDVGPLRYDHAEYVFGSERPDTYTRAGLDVSPAVVQYLGLNSEKHPTTRWRFVDEDDVPPGTWLKLDEEAILYRAMHHMGSDGSSQAPPQRYSQPVDDMEDDSNKKKVGNAKG
jgi:hypothetical protein